MAIRYIEFGPGRQGRDLCELEIMHETGSSRAEVEEVLRQVDAVVPLAHELGVAVARRKMSRDAAREELCKDLPWMSDAAADALQRYGEFCAEKG